MPNESASLLRPLLEVLRHHGVEFMLVGGQAESLMGSARPTYDTDLCYRRSPDNLRRLAVALRTLNPKLRNAPADLPFILDEKSLALGSNFTFETDHGPLDLLGWVEPIGNFDELVKRA